MKPGKSPPCRLRSLLPLAASVALIAAVTAGCGAGEKVTTAAEGRDVTLGGLDYLVQVARILNRSDAEDRSYLAGQAEAPNGYAYLGVFIQVRNDAGGTLAPSSEFSVVDTLGNRYEPLPIDNDFAYRAEPLGSGEQLPVLDSTAETGPTAGGELLFLIKQSSTENDPLYLEIKSPEQQAGKITLDI